MSRTFAVICVLSALALSGPRLWAGADIVIYYNGRPGITHHNVPLLDYVFFQLDQMRTDIQQSVADDINVQSSRISSASLSVGEDLVFELVGLDGQRVALSAAGFRANAYFKYKCPLNIKKAQIDASINRAVIETEYDLNLGSTPYNTTISGFNIRVRPGISACSFAALFNWWLNVFGISIDSFIEDLLADTFEDRIEDALTTQFNLAGLGTSFLDLDPYVQAIPDHLFTSIGLTKSAVLGVLRNPFSGIRLKVMFDEDGVGYGGDNDQLKIWIDVPWEELPIATFTHTMLQGKDVRLDASGSYDPDGGSLTYRWQVGTSTLTRSSPVLYYTFPAYGPQYVHLTVIDDEGAVRHETKYIEVCDRSNPLQITCGSGFP